MNMPQREYLDVLIKVSKKRKTHRRKKKSEYSEENVLPYSLVPKSKGQPRKHCLMIKQIFCLFIHLIFCYEYYYRIVLV